MQTPLNAVLARVTDVIRERSHVARDRYPARIDAALAQGTAPQRSHHGCVNLDHGLAGCAQAEKQRLLSAGSVNLGIISACNDMLSAHQPCLYFPDIIKRTAERRCRCTSRRKPLEVVLWAGCGVATSSCSTAPLAFCRPKSSIRNGSSASRQARIWPTMPAATGASCLPACASWPAAPSRAP